MNDPLKRKIVAPAGLAATLRRARADGQTVVQCHGCFDIVHPGHIRYLQFARQLGDVLVVSLTGDARIEKGPDRPYIPQELRAENLAAIELVDWVVIDPHPTAVELLDQLRPDVYVKGREYAQSTDPRFLRERQTVEGYGGRVVFHSGDVVFSSTRLLENIGRDALLDEQRLRAFCARNGLDLANLTQIVDSFEGLRVVVVGDLIHEEYVFCDAREAADDAPLLAAQKLGTTEYWGGAAGLALQLKALGAKPFLLAAVGKDRASERVARQLTELGLDGRLLRDRKGLIERRTFVADDSKLFRVSEGAAAPLDSAAEKRAIAVLREELADAALLVWADHGYGMLTPGLIEAAGRELRKRDCRVAGHAPGQRGQLGAWSGCDLLTASERQLRETTHDMGSGLPAVAWNLLNRTSGRALVVSLRRRGLIGFDTHTGKGRSSRTERLKSEFIPALAAHFVDLQGAEDAVLAAAALTITTARSLPLATYLAAGAEAVAVGRIGGQKVTAEELRRWLAGRPELDAVAGAVRLGRHTAALQAAQVAPVQLAARPATPAEPPRRRTDRLAQTVRLVVSDAAAARKR